VRPFKVDALGKEGATRTHHSMQGDNNDTKLRQHGGALRWVAATCDSFYSPRKERGVRRGQLIKEGTRGGWRSSGKRNEGGGGFNSIAERGSLAPGDDHMGGEV
jgi:hypothetical protein